MRGVSVSVVKNEADIIEAMVRHNSQFLDFMTFFDNGSTDGTYEILQALKEEGLPISVTRDDRTGHIQTALINGFVKSADCDRSAYVFPLDGDELLSADLAAFREYLATKPPSFLMQWKTYVPTVHDDLRNPNAATRLTHCRRREPELTSNYKVVLAPHHKGKTEIRAGNHRISGSKQDKTEVIRLAHFPIRSAEQLACKVLLGAWNVALRGSTRMEAFQWFDLAQRIRSQGLPTREELTEIAASYAVDKPARIRVDPLRSPGPVELRYVGLAKSPLLAGLIQFTDTLVARLKPVPAATTATDAAEP